MSNVVEIILKATDKTSGLLDKSTSKLESFGKAATKLGIGLTAGVTVPLVGIGLASINAASDLGESLNKVGVVFGESAIEIEAWSKTAASSFGISQQGALEAVGTFGNLFTAMGVGETASSDMSTGLVQLAADLASFNNIDPTVALEKLRAGLTGESEPLKSLGVLLTATAVEAKALEMGLADAAGEFDAAALATARYALIMEQTATAQGDFANTSEGLANSTRIMKAQLSDASAALGESLLPIALKVVTALSGLVESFNGLSPAAQKTIVVVGGIIAAIGPLLIIVGQVSTAFAAISGLFAAGGALAGAGAAISAFAATAGTALAGVAAAAAPVVIPILVIGAAIAGLYLLIKELGPGIVENWSNIWTMAVEIFRVFRENLATDWDTFWMGISARLSTAWADLVAKAQGIVDGIKAAFTIDWTALGSGIIDGIKFGITNGVAGLVASVVSAAKSALDAAKNFLGIDSPSTVFAEVGHNIMTGMASGIMGSAALPVGALGVAAPAMMAAPGITMNNTINNGIDIERVAFRVAEVISSRQR